MPFTLAHPAIMIPFVRSNKISLTGLLMGCMVPDFEFFFQMREVENIGHHWYGILLFDLPVALLFCYIFHNLLKQLLVINLPVVYRNKFINTIDLNWNVYVAHNKWKVIISVLVGILSHIAWDAFTHYDGFFVLLFPVLTSNIYIIKKAFPLYFLLQIFSSITGLWLVFHYIKKMPPKENINVDVKGVKYYWPVFLTVFIVIILFRIILWPQFNSFWGIVMGCLGAFIYTWILISLIFKKIQEINQP